MSVTLIRWDQHRVMPWRNGQGTTREVAVEPGAAPDRPFLWRLSIASVEADGPFSAFPGYDRTILMLDGKGMELHFQEAAGIAVSARFVPVHFDGGWTTTCHLTGGPVRDLNLMVDRARARADSRVTGAGRLETSGGTVLVHALDGPLSVICGGPHTDLASGETLRLDQPDCPVALAGAGRAFVADITPI